MNAMTDITSSIPTSNYGVGRSGVLIDTLVYHHIVGDAPAAISRFRTPGVEVSSSYIISSTGQVYLAVKEGNTPYTNGDYAWNQRSITIEHAGGTVAVPYTEAMYKASIALCRDIMSRHKITQFKRHRDVIDMTRYPGGTACPGTLDVERIVNEAKKGGIMTLSPHIIGRLVKGLWGHDATQAELDKYTKIEALEMLQRIVDDDQTDKEYARVKALETTNAPPTVLEPGEYKVN